MGGNTGSTRRSFLSQASGAIGSGWIASQWPLFLAAASAACSRRDGGEPFANLDESLGLTLEAIAEQIIPADESPGARDAGVVWFIDQLIGSTGSGMRSVLEAGVADLDVRAGAGRKFVELPFDEQTMVVKAIETSPFFATMRFLTVSGMFVMPEHGGNRGKAGWKLIGFADRHSWQPPFGYYDEGFGPNESDS